VFIASCIGDAYGVDELLSCWGMAMVLVKLAFFFFAGFGVEVQQSLFGRLFFQTLTISGAEWVFSEVRAGNHAAPQS
jgi:hypothetical protein